MNVKLDGGAYFPDRAHGTDAGLDIKVPERVSIDPCSYVTVDTGIHVQIPKGFCGILKSKSGLSVTENVHTIDGVIDSGYTGSIRVKLHNCNLYRTVSFAPGDKITQLVIIPCCTPDLELVRELDDADRGDNGFGSTGA